MAEASRRITDMAENIKQLKNCNKRKLPEAGQSCVPLWSQIHSKLGRRIDSARFGAKDPMSKRKAKVTVTHQSF